MNFQRMKIPCEKICLYSGLETVGLVNDWREKNQRIRLTKSYLLGENNPIQAPKRKK